MRRRARRWSAVQTLRSRRSVARAVTNTKVRDRRDHRVKRLLEPPWVVGARCHALAAPVFPGTRVARCVEPPHPPVVRVVRQQLERRERSPDRALVAAHPRTDRPVAGGVDLDLIARRPWDRVPGELRVDHAQLVTEVEVVHGGARRQIRRGQHRARVHGRGLCRQTQRHQRHQGDRQRAGALQASPSAVDRVQHLLRFL